MKRIGILVAVLFAIVLGFKAAPAVAESLVQASENLSSVASDKTVDGTAFLAGDTVQVQGTVKGDVFCAGSTVTVSGVVEGDVICAANSLTVSGTVKGDVRLAGNTVMLGGIVDGSVTLAANSVVTDSSGFTVGRDFTVGANTVTFGQGSIGRDLKVGAMQLTLSGTVGRSVDASVTTMSIAKNAKIGGNLVYASENETNVPAGVVTGSVEHRAPIQYSKAPSFTAASILMGLLIAVVMFAVSAVVVVLVAPRYVHRVSDVTGVKQYILYFLVGLVGAVVAPVLGIVLLMTVVGAYAALLLGVAVTLSLMVGSSLVAYRLGRFMLDGRAKPLSSALVGSLALGVLCVIPFVGWLAIFVTTMIGFGMVILGMRSQYPETETVATVKKPTRKATRSS